MITKNDVVLAGDCDGVNAEQDAEQLCQLIKSGNTEEAAAEVHRLFERLADQKLDIEVTRAYVVQLYSAMIQVCPPEEATDFTQRMAELTHMNTLSDLNTFVADSATRLTAGYYKIILAANLRRWRK